MAPHVWLPWCEFCSRQSLWARALSISRPSHAVCAADFVPHPTDRPHRYSGDNSFLVPLHEMAGRVLRFVQNLLLHSSEHSTKLRRYLACDVEFVPCVVVPYLQLLTQTVSSKPSIPDAGMGSLDMQAIRLALAVLVVATFKIKAIRMSILASKVASTLLKSPAICKDIACLSLLVKLNINMDFAAPTAGQRKREAAAKARSRSGAKSRQQRHASARSGPTDDDSDEHPHDDDEDETHSEPLSSTAQATLDTIRAAVFALDPDQRAALWARNSRDDAAAPVNQGCVSYSLLRFAFGAFHFKIEQTSDLNSTVSTKGSFLGAAPALDLDTAALHHGGRREHDIHAMDSGEDIYHRPDARGITPRESPMNHAGSGTGGGGIALDLRPVHAQRTAEEEAALPSIPTARLLTTERSADGGMSSRSARISPRDGIAAADRRSPARSGHKAPKPTIAAQLAVLRAEEESPSNAGRAARPPQHVSPQRRASAGSITVESLSPAMTARARTIIDPDGIDDASSASSSISPTRSLRPLGHGAALGSAQSEESPEPAAEDMWAEKLQPLPNRSMFGARAPHHLAPLKGAAGGGLAPLGQPAARPGTASTATVEPHFKCALSKVRESMVWW